MRTRVDEAVWRFRRSDPRGAGTPTSVWWVALYEGHERARLALREAVILEGANVPCELVRDGGSL